MSKKMRVLKVYHELHSMVIELGRFTKTSGFHYDVILQPDQKPQIVHHSHSWKIEPGFVPGTFMVYTFNMPILKITPKYIHYYPDYDPNDLFWDTKYEEYDALDTSQKFLTAKQLHDLIINSVAKYAIARFLQITPRPYKLVIEIDLRSTY
jgi:hypothetical protein